jgi:hypothetical protein
MFPPFADYPSRFYRIVDHAYLTANQRLLDLMLKEKGLIPYLRWVAVRAY